MYANRRNFRVLKEIGVVEHDGDVRFFTGSGPQWKICNTALIYGRIAEIFASWRKSGPRNTMETSDFRPEVEIRPFRACAMHPAIITGTVRSLLTWLWGRYHVPQNVFLVKNTFLHSYSTFPPTGMTPWTAAVIWSHTGMYYVTCFQWVTNGWQCGNQKL